MQEQAKWVKNQKSIETHSSFDGLIQEDIDLSDDYLAVQNSALLMIDQSEICLV